MQIAGKTAAFLLVVVAGGSGFGAGLITGRMFPAHHYQSLTNVGGPFIFDTATTRSKNVWRHLPASRTQRSCGA